MFLRDAELLVFDDLSSALDVATEAQLWQRLKDWGGVESGEITCLVVSHRPAAFARADRILVMAQGRLVADGSFEELRESSPEFRELWLRELEEGSRKATGVPLVGQAGG
jgi:ATP-binding cassette subfamily B protein